MNQYKVLSETLHRIFEENKVYLCQLDAAAGDGDHGLTISRGFTAAWEKIQKMPDETSPAELFKTIGYAMLETMGGASGPIFSTFFIQAAICLRGGGELTAENLHSVLLASYNAVADLCEAKEGEKTMLDALHGALEAVAADCPDKLSQALQIAEEGAKKGAESTIDMIATKGRARFLGERSRGFMDAGSWSVVLIFHALSESLGNE